MSYVRRLEQRKNKEKQPEGRHSWKDAINQAQGNLRWMLENFDSKEIIDMIAEEAYKEEKDVYPPKKRFIRHKILIKYFTEMEQKCKTELNQIEKACDFEELDIDQETKSLEKLRDEL